MALRYKSGERSDGAAEPIARDKVRQWFRFSRIGRKPPHRFAGSLQAGVRRYKSCRPNWRDRGDLGVQMLARGVFKACDILGPEVKNATQRAFFPPCTGGVRSLSRGETPSRLPGAR